MSTWISAPLQPVASDKLDTAAKFLMAQPVSPSAAFWISSPQIFTIFGQQTTGTATIT